MDNTRRTAAALIVLAAGAFVAVQASAGSGSDPTPEAADATHATGSSRTIIPPTHQVAPPVAETTASPSPSEPLGTDSPAPTSSNEVTPSTSSSPSGAPPQEGKPNYDALCGILAIGSLIPEPTVATVLNSIGPLLGCKVGPPNPPSPTSPPPSPTSSKPSPSPSSSTTKSPTPAPGPNGDLVQQVLDKTNAERAKAGLSALKLDACLSAKVAQTWAQQMAKENRLYHQDMSGVGQKCPGRGYAGENIAMGYRTAAEAMNGWMNSQGHKENILRPGYKYFGGGVAKSSNGQLYWVQDFSG